MDRNLYKLNQSAAKVALTVSKIRSLALDALGFKFHLCVVDVGPTIKDLNFHCYQGILCYTMLKMGQVRYIVICLIKSKNVFASNFSGLPCLLQLDTRLHSSD